MNAIIQYTKESIIGLLSSLFPEMMYWRRARKIYHNRTGKTLHYQHPKELNEKLMWLTRYWRDPIKTQCADKYLVREFIKSKGLDHLLIPLYGVYRESNEIDFNELPEMFVLKCNHGCGYNLFINNKSNTDLRSIKNQLDVWLKEEFHNNYCEIHYRDIPHRIICEKMISEDAPVEYQFWCVNGIPDSILVCRKNHNGTYDSWSYSTEWEHLCDRIGEDPGSSLPRPANLDSMIEYARTLSSSFPFVRVDLYEVENVVYFAELTFSPCANVLNRYNESFHKRVGAKLILPSQK